MSNGYINQECSATFGITVTMDDELTKEQRDAAAQDIAAKLEEALSTNNDKDDFEASVAVEELNPDEQEEGYVSLRVSISYTDQAEYELGSKSHDWYVPDDPTSVDEIDYMGDMETIITKSFESIGIDPVDIDFYDSEDFSESVETLYERVESLEQDAYEAHLEDLADARRNGDFDY